MVGEAGTDYPRIHIVGTPLPLRPAMMVMRAREHRVKEKSL